MNKQQTNPIGDLAKALVPVVNKIVQPSKGNITGKKRKRSQKGSKIPRDRSLKLTRTQFTATTPLQFFETTKSSTPGGLRVRGRELVREVNLAADSTGAFALGQDFGQAGFYGRGNPSVFPRLSKMANAYEYFIFHSVTYIFQSSRATVRDGTVLMCIDYDPTDVAPGSATAMMRNISSTMANVYSDCSLQVLKSLSRLPRYEVDEGMGPGAYDEPLQQLQYRLYVGHSGYTGVAGENLGHIIAEYEIEFFTPQ